MTNIALFKFALVALLAIWPAAVESKFYPGPKVDRPDVVLTQDTPDLDVKTYCHGGPNAPSERRVCRIAREVATVVDEHAAHGRLPFTGPAAAQATVLALLEIARHESGFRAKVEDCRITGDMPSKYSKITEGRAISLFQLQSNNWYDLFEMVNTKPPRYRWYSRAAICASNQRAAQLALQTLMRQAWVSSAHKSLVPSSIRSMFFSYSGNGGQSSKAGIDHVEYFALMMRENGIRLVPSKGAMWAEVKK